SKQWWTSLGAGTSVARTESDPLCEELPHTNIAVSRRERFPCTAKSNAGKLERAATAAHSESPAGLARREPLDIKRREQSLLVPGALRVAQEIPRRAKRHEHLDRSVIRGPYLCGSLRISASSALKGQFNAENAEIRREPQR